jgi:hypothetical protein
LKRHVTSRIPCGSSNWSRPSSRGVGARVRRPLPACSDGPSVGFAERSCSLVPAPARPPARRHRSPRRSPRRSPCHTVRRAPGYAYPSVNQMVISGPRLNRPLSSGSFLVAGAVRGLFLQRQCKLVTHTGSMPSPNTSLQRTPARIECIALRRPAAVGNALATSAYGRTLGPLSSGR